MTFFPICLLVFAISLVPCMSAPIVDVGMTYPSVAPPNQTMQVSSIAPRGPIA